MAKKPANAVAHLLRIKAMPCCTCGAPPPSEAHHIREQGGRIGDFACIPLCDTCHRSNLGVHGDKTMLRITNRTELQHLNEILSQLL